MEQRLYGSTDEFLLRRLERERRIRMEAEAIAEEATRRMYEHDRLKSLFVSTVSHELRTPLTPILGFSETLTHRWTTLPDSKRLDIVGRIHRNAEVLSALVEELLDLTRLESGQVVVEPEDVLLDEEMRVTLDRLATLFEHHHLEDDLQPGLVGRVDRIALGRMLTNVLDNAVTYSPEGSTISLSLAESGGEALIAVDDCGPGIHEVDRDRVFERFYRGRSATELSSRGLGIGLAVVKTLAESMGGAVGAEKAPTGGARVWFRLPLAEPAEALG